MVNGILILKSSRSKKLPGLSLSKKAPQSLNLLVKSPLRRKRRISTGHSEIDRILGGGLVPGSLLLFGGEPGVGKSTLALQLAMKMTGRKILYVSGEESGEQIKLRSRKTNRLK